MMLWNFRCSVFGIVLRLFYSDLNLLFFRVRLDVSWKKRKIFESVCVELSCDSSTNKFYSVFLISLCGPYVMLQIISKITGHVTRFNMCGIECVFQHSLLHVWWKFVLSSFNESVASQRCTIRCHLDTWIGYLGYFKDKNHGKTSVVEQFNDLFGSEITTSHLRFLVLFVERKLVYILYQEIRNWTTSSGSGSSLKVRNVMITRSSFSSIFSNSLVYNYEE